MNELSKNSANTLTLRDPQRLCPLPPRRQSGAALVIGMLLLLVLTILAFTGLNSSTTELAMASNEQFRRNAAQASASGIENAISNLRNVPTTLGGAPVISGLRPANGSPVDRYNTRTRYLGEERGIPQSSIDRFVGLHFEIESDGTSARNARDTQTQGVFVVSGTGGPGASDFAQIGTGLE
jgi:type IV pilus assembly protein PilX